MNERCDDRTAGRCAADPGTRNGLGHEGMGVDMIVLRNSRFALREVA